MMAFISLEPDFLPRITGSVTDQVSSRILHVNSANWATTHIYTKVSETDLAAVVARLESTESELQINCILSSIF
jgi:hypothetical protein